MTAKTQAQKATLQFLASLRQRNASVHTLKAYRGDLEAFSVYIGQRDLKAVDHVAIRGFLSHLYHKGLGKTSVARALAALRSLYHWMAQEGMVQQNPAALVSTPKLPKKLPRVPTIEEMNIVLDGKMPKVDQNGLHVVITWSRDNVQLYLNAKPTGVTRLPPPKKGPADA